MAAVLELGHADPPRLARLRFGSQARNAIDALRGGTPLPDGLGPLPARIFVKDGTSPPLGDCPRSREGVVFSERARCVLEPHMDHFDFVPVVFYGVGAERKSGVWYEQPLEAYANPGELQSPFWLVHANRTRLPGHREPVIADGFPGDDADDGEDADLRRVSRRIAASLHFRQNMPTYFRKYFGARTPPPVFAFGPAGGLFFSDAIRGIVAKAKLKGFTFSEIVAL